MRTTLELPDSLFREVKARAAQNGLTLKELLAQYIELGLRSGTGSSAADPRNRAPLPVALRRNPALLPTPAKTNRDLAELLAAQDLAGQHRFTNPNPPPG
jgi:hypothetical protein